MKLYAPQSYIVSYVHTTRNHQQDAKQHVGLKNQGATCYMNSLLQQLFHIPDFRHGLLTLELEEEKGEGAAKGTAAPASLATPQKGEGAKEEEDGGKAAAASGDDE